MPWGVLSSGFVEIPAEYMVTALAVVMRPISRKAVNQSAPSGPAVMAYGGIVIPAVKCWVEPVAPFTVNVACCEVSPVAAAVTVGLAMDVPS